MLPKVALQPHAHDLAPLPDCGLNDATRLFLGTVVEHNALARARRINNGTLQARQLWDVRSLIESRHDSRKVK